MTSLKINTKKMQIFENIISPKGGHSCLYNSQSQQSCSKLFSNKGENPGLKGVDECITVLKSNVKHWERQSRNSFLLVAERGSRDSPFDTQ